MWNNAALIVNTHRSAERVGHVVGSHGKRQDEGHHESDNDHPQGVRAVRIVQYARCSPGCGESRPLRLTGHGRFQGEVQIIHPWNKGRLLFYSPKIKKKLKEGRKNRKKKKETHW